MKYNDTGRQRKKESGDRCGNYELKGILARTMTLHDNLPGGSGIVPSAVFIGG